MSRRSAPIAAALLLAVLAACGVEGGERSPAPGGAPTTTTSDSDGGATTTTAPLSTEPAGGDPSACEDAAAIGEVLGAEVDGFPSEGEAFGSEIEHTYAGCTYTSFDEDSFGFLDVERLTADDPGEVRLFDALDGEARAAVWRDGFTPVDDLGDDAYLDGTTVVVRQGDLLVFADFEPEDLATLTAPTPAIDLARAALELDLAPDQAPPCGVVEPVVAEVLGEVEDSITSTGFLSVNDVSITTAGCDVDLAEGGSAGIAVADASPWEAWVEAKGSFDLRSSYERLEVGGRPAFDDGRRLVVDDRVAGAAHQPWVIDTGLWDGDPVEGAERRLAVAEAVIDG